MGPRFLFAYYQSVLDFEASIALVAHDSKSDNVLGFAVGFSEPTEFYDFFRRRRKRIFLAILMASLRDPRLVPQILRNMRRVEVQAQPPVSTVELSSIAVGAPGRGIGSLLLEAFTDLARSQGALRVILTTDAVGNDPVREFYEAHNFRLDGYEQRGERRMCRYVRPLG